MAGPGGLAFLRPRHSTEPFRNVHPSGSNLEQCFVDWWGRRRESNRVDRSAWTRVGDGP